MRSVVMKKAALVSGLRVKQLKFLSYVINGMTAALAGILLAARVAVGSPTAGESYDLLAITAVVVGGTSNAGGTGGILPSIIGVFIVTVMNNGMDLLGISGYYQKIVTGVVVLLAVIIDRNNVNRNH
ncbi:MAG: ABC transporter permease [Oscillospiraceae bacterium]